MRKAADALCTECTECSRAPWSVGVCVFVVHPAFNTSCGVDVLCGFGLRRQDVAAHQFCKTRDYQCTYGGLDEEKKPHVTNLQVWGAWRAQRLVDPLSTPIPQINSTLSSTFWGTAALLLPFKFLSLAPP